MSLHLQRLSGPYFKVEDLYHLDLSYYRSWSTSDDCLKNDLTWDYSPDQVLNEDLKSKVIKTLQMLFCLHKQLKDGPTLTSNLFSSFRASSKQESNSEIGAEGKDADH